MSPAFFKLFFLTFFQNGHILIHTIKISVLEAAAETEVEIILKKHIRLTLAVIF